MRSRASFILLLVSFLMLFSGCVSLQVDWLRGIVAPRWQVPFSVPILQPIRIDLSALQSVPIPDDGIQIDFGIAAELVVTDEVKALLAHPSVLGLTVTFDVISHAPIGLELELHFLDAYEEAGDSVVVQFAVPSGTLDGTGRTVVAVHETVRLEMSQALRELLTREHVYVTPRFTVVNKQTGPDGIEPRFSNGDYVAVRGFVTVTVGVNY